MNKNRLARSLKWFFYSFVRAACLQFAQRTYNVFVITFEWDTAKATSNKKKHGISVAEAQSVFYDEFAVQFFDEDNSVLED